MSQSPSISGQTSLIPVNDCLLVKLDHTNKKEGKYDTRTSGTVIAVPKETNDKDGWGTVVFTPPSYLLGKHVFFEEYKEGARIKRDGEQLCFIKYEDVRGYEDV